METTETGEQSPRWGTIKTREQYEAEGKVATLSEKSGRWFFPEDQVEGRVNSNMLLLGGTRVRATVSGKYLTITESPSLKAVQEWTWFEHMVEWDKEEPPALIDESERFAVRICAPMENREAALQQEFATAWNTLRESHKDLVRLRPETKGVVTIIKDAVKERAWMQEAFGFGDDLRVTVNFTQESDHILQDNEHLKYVWHNYIRGWLNAAGYDPDSVNIASNTILNKKGQETRLTKILQQVVPESPGSAFLERCQRVAFARKLPNRDSSIALLSTALRGGGAFTLSGNPADFITCSVGGGFSSCHAPGGAHFHGNLGLARTGKVLMGYIGTPAAKTGRMWIWVDAALKQIWQLKSYGIFPAHYRKPVREYLEYCLEPNAHWVHTPNAPLSVKNQKTSGYLDTGNIDAAYLKSRTRQIELDANGKPPLCIICGGSSPKQQTGSCCLTPGMVRCRRCRVEVDQSQALTHQGNTYCSDCLFTCEECNTVVVGIASVREGRHLCPPCARNLYTDCIECGTTHRRTNSQSVTYYRGRRDRRYIHYEGQLCPSCVTAKHHCTFCDTDVHRSSWSEPLGRCLACAHGRAPCSCCGAVQTERSLIGGRCGKCRKGLVFDEYTNSRESPDETPEAKQARHEANNPWRQFTASTIRFTGA